MAISYSTSERESVFQNRPKQFVLDFLNCISDDEYSGDNNTKKELIAKLNDEYEQQFNSFINDYYRLDRNSVNLRAAKEFISDEFEVSWSEIDAENRYELLLSLYQIGIEEKLDLIIAGSRIVDKSSRRAYEVPTEVSLSEVEEKAGKFQRTWNSEGTDAARIQTSVDSESNYAQFEVFKEYGRRTVDEFQFRKNNENEMPNSPNISSTKYYPLKKLRFSVNVADGKTEFIFSDDHTSGWKTFLDSLFESLFDNKDIYGDLERKTSKVAENIQEEAAEAGTDNPEEMDVDKTPTEIIQDSIADKKEKAKTRVDNLDLPSDEKTDLKDRISTIELGGSEVRSDPSTGADDLRIVADLSNLFNSVSEIQNSFEDLLTKAAQENVRFVVKVMGKPIVIDSGSWRPLNNGRMSDRNKRALEIFFDEER